MCFFFFLKPNITSNIFFSEPERPYAHSSSGALKFASNAVARWIISFRVRTGGRYFLKSGVLIGHGGVFIVIPINVSACNTHLL